MNKVAAGVVMAIPDFPYSHLTRKDVVGIPIYGLKSPTTSNVHLCEVMQGLAPAEKNGKINPAPCLVTAGDYLLVTSGVGDTVRSAAGAAYRTMKKIEVPNSPFWRPDIGQRLQKQLPELQKMGFAKGLSY
jgi:phosphoribosylamine--glycine ligase